MAKKFVPAGHRLLIKRVEVKETQEGWKFDEAGELKTDTGLVIAGTDIEKKTEKNLVNRGTVLAIGATAWQAQWLGDGKLPWCKVGDTVLFAKYSGTHFTDEDTKEEYLIVNDEDVIMILEDKENE